MASNKECLIAVLDVRSNANEEFKLKSNKFVAEILKDKICTARKDYVSFVLMGTERTFNDANTKYASESYMNIVQYPHVQLATWNFLVEFFKFVNETSCKDGDWLDALVVAIEMIKSNEEIFKVQRRRIILFHNFDCEYTNYDQFDVITTSMAELEIDFTVVSSNIMYIDNALTGLPQPVFRQTKCPDSQLENEKYALRLVTNCNANLYNFENGTLTRLLKVKNKRPWMWNSTLMIGSKIKIRISGFIAIKDENKIKLKKRWAEENEFAKRELVTYLHSEEIEPLEDDLIEGYMLGSTPIPYDESLKDDKCENEPGLTFIGFVKRREIPNEYFCGDSLYWIVHQKNMTCSAQKLDALVKAMHKTEMLMLCWKVYSARLNRQRLVALLPNQLHDEKPASLSMLELSYNIQHHYWDFPTLCTEKPRCSAEQTAAIDKLIDAMDLTIDNTKDNMPRAAFQKDLMPFDNLPNIYTQNLKDILERKIICNVSEDDEQFQEMLQDKNFVDVFWRVPEAIERQAKNAAKTVKELFPLEQSTLPLEKAKARANAEQNIANDSNIKPETLTIAHVGQRTPATDFEKLLQHLVIPLRDHTLRDSKYQEFAAEMRLVIYNLLFTATYLETEKIENALKVYRKSCYDFHVIDDYNKWLAEIKVGVIERELYDFWHKVIVKQDLGLCFFGEPTLEEKLASEHFYKIVNAHCDFDDDEDDDDALNESIDMLLAKKS